MYDMHIGARHAAVSHVMPAARAEPAADAAPAGPAVPDLVLRYTHLWSTWQYAAELAIREAICRNPCLSTQLRLVLHIYEHTTACNGMSYKAWLLSVLLAPPGRIRFWLSCMTVSMQAMGASSG